MKLFQSIQKWTAIRRFGMVGVVAITVIIGLIGFPGEPASYLTAKASTLTKGCEHHPTMLASHRYFACETEASPCLRERNPSTFAPVACLPKHTVVYIAAQTQLKAHPVYGSAIWDVLMNGDLVSDFYVNTGHSTSFSPPIPTMPWMLDGTQPIATLPTATSTSTATPDTTASTTPTAIATATATSDTTATATPIASATTTPTTTNAQPVGQAGNWKMIFDDEFTGPTLNTNVWTTCFFNFHLGNGCYHDQNELQFYLPQNVLLNNGVLSLQAQKQTVTEGGKTFHYTSGMISSGPANDGAKSGFSFTYGYTEMRARVPAGQGMWTGFWMLAADESYPPEIDVEETLGQTPREVNLNYHYPDGSSEGSDEGNAWDGPDFTSDWHTYAVDWEPGSLTWYVDGVARYHTTGHVTSKAMYLIANLAVGGDWPGPPNASTKFPSSFQIDYIRVWQK